MTVMTLNNITNQGGYAWTPFDVKTDMKLPRGEKLIPKYTYFYHVYSFVKIIENTIISSYRPGVCYTR